MWVPGYEPDGDSSIRLHYRPTYKNEKNNITFNNYSANNSDTLSTHYYNDLYRLIGDRRGYNPDTNNNNQLTMPQRLYESVLRGDRYIQVSGVYDDDTTGIYKYYITGSTIYFVFDVIYYYKPAEPSLYDGSDRNKTAVSC